MMIDRCELGKSQSRMIVDTKYVVSCSTSRRPAITPVVNVSVIRRLQLKLRASGKGKLERLG